jgi:hypothetical protein
LFHPLSMIKHIPMGLLRRLLLSGCLIILLSACHVPAGDQAEPHTPTIYLTPSPSVTPTSQHTVTPTTAPTPAILVGAGDISICGQKGDDHTAELLAGIPGAIFTVGDNSNESGTAYEYRNCFGPSWGQFLERLYPVPGNHDYVTDNAGPYFEYFSGGPVTPGKGYYSYDLGGWHVIALNSVIDIREGSLQLKWLHEDLASQQNLCSLAYWHHPRWTSGESGNDGRLAAVWRVLYASGVDVVVNGNEHLYERFAPMNPDGEMELASGIREFVVGTGGVSHYRFAELHPNSQVRDNTSFGVLKFTLFSDGYAWEFMPVAGMDFTDSGRDICH